jgi:hypothetical protein
VSSEVKAKHRRFKTEIVTPNLAPSADHVITGPSLRLRLRAANHRDTAYHRSNQHYTAQCPYFTATINSRAAPSYYDPSPSRNLTTPQLPFLGALLADLSHPYPGHPYPHGAKETTKQRFSSAECGLRQGSVVTPPNIDIARARGNETFDGP